MIPGQRETHSNRRAEQFLGGWGVRGHWMGPIWVGSNNYSRQCKCMIFFSVISRKKKGIQKWPLLLDDSSLPWESMASSGCRPRPILTFTLKNSAVTASVPGAYPFRGGSTVLWQSNLSSWRFLLFAPFWALWPPWVVGRWDKSSGIDINSAPYQIPFNWGIWISNRLALGVFGGCEPPSCYDKWYVRFLTTYCR